MSSRQTDEAGRPAGVAGALVVCALYAFLVALALAVQFMRLVVKDEPPGG